MASENQTDLNLISLDALKRAVHNALAQTGLDIIAIYLHGSYATAHQREESDVDLAVLPERALSLEEGLSFSVALQTELGSCEIDLADATCQYRVCCTSGDQWATYLYRQPRGCRPL